MLVFKKIISLPVTLAAFLIVSVQLLPAQQRDSLQTKIDSLRKESKEAVIDTSVASLLKKTEMVTHILNNVKSILNRGFDTVEVASDLPEIESGLENLEKNYQDNQRTLSLRSLKIIKSILGDYEQRLKKWQQLLLSYSREMQEINNDLNKIIQDTSSFFLAADSAVTSNYLKQIIVFTNKWGKADSSNKINLQKIDILQTRVSTASITNAEILDETNYRIKNYSKQLLKPEEKFLWNASAKDYTDKFSDVLKKSVFISYRIVSYYLNNKSINIIAWLFFILIVAAWFRNSIKRIGKMGDAGALILSNTKSISQHPLLSVILIFTSILPFFSKEQPGSLTIVMWLFVSLLYTKLFINLNIIKLRKEWILLIILFLIVNSFNLLTKATLTERWLHLILVILTFLLGLVTYKKISKGESNLPIEAKYFLIIFLILLSFAFVLNIIGCYVLSKYIAGGALTGLLTARILYTVVAMIIESIYLQYEAYKNKSRFISYFDYYKLKSEIQKALNIFAGIVWLIILTRNLNFYDVIYENVSEFLSDERTLGNIQFTFSSILVFVIVLWVSSLVSKTLLLVFGNDNGTVNNPKNKWGSTLLLTRLGVLSLGIILAFVASGIPMDKITIIIGALGVGIGFGLQNIVNNLVSGVILAFEKPVEVGDAIEVGNRYGIVKEIGIRSSRMLTVDGSEVIVPNGDLISQQIVNWTLSNHYRRVEVIVGVSYQSDLRKVEELLRDILQKQKDIQQYPAPNVLAHVFGQSSVDFRLLFWCNIDTWINVKSEVLINVYESFKENDIQIPFPQTDVHIKTDQ